MRLLITGAAGMLACDVARAGERAGHELVLRSHGELDITDAAAVERALGQARPDAVVNCAGWTDVDGAESRPQDAYAVNAEGPGNLARSAAGAGVALVHISSDYVFDGEPRLDAAGRPRPYVESDPTAPRSVYGSSKLAGEQRVLGSCTLHTVVRSSWLFGSNGPNFVDTMLGLAGEREVVEVVSDQTGCPTWTGHLAPALVGLIEREVRGLVHLAGTGAVSWNGFAREIFRQAEVSCRVDPATTGQLGRAAPRPSWSALCSERGDVLAMPDWRDGLAGYLAARAGIVRA